MLTALLLLGHAGLLAGPGAALLRHARWPERAPRLGVTAWLTLAVSVVGSVLVAAVTVAVSAAHPTGGIRPCHAPARWTCDPFAHGHLLPAAGAVIAVAVAARLLWCSAAAARAARRGRRDQLDALAVVGRADSALGAIVVEHPDPAAYCVPGRHGRVVVTAGAVAALDAAQLAAVLAHERAHLRQRHHLALAAGRAIARAFPFVPVLGTARDQVVRLVELAADDAAARCTGRLTVAEALLGLAAATPAPEVAALAAGGTAAGARARRLIAAPRPLGVVRAVIGVTVSAIVLAAPLTAAVSALAASATGAPSVACCTTSAAAPAGTPRPYAPSAHAVNEPAPAW